MIINVGVTHLALFFISAFALLLLFSSHEIQARSRCENVGVR